jgi:hypothetical protein
LVSASTTVGGDQLGGRDQRSALVRQHRLELDLTPLAMSSLASTRA